MTSFSRSSPQDDYAERSLIGAALISEEVYPGTLGRIAAPDFYTVQHQSIWKAIGEVFNDGKDVNLTTVSSKATKERSGEYLATCMRETSSTRYFSEWVERIQNASRKRTLINAANDIIKSAFEEGQAVDAEDRARNILDAIITDEEREALLTPEKQALVLRAYIESRKDTNALLVRTGFPELDLHCGGGLRRGDLIIIAARTSVGKSTYAENIAENVSNNGQRVLFASVEMTPDQMMYRYAKRSGGLSDSTLEYGINSPTEDESVGALQELRKAMPFYIFDAPTATVPMIRAQISRLTAVSGALSLVVVDYLQLLADAGAKGRDDKEHLRIGQITKSLKHLAREYDVPIILISQLNRNLEYRGGEPKLADLRESGRIEEDADLVLMLWELEEADATGNNTRLKIAKNRQGPQGPLPIRFHKPSFKFTEPAHAREQVVNEIERLFGTAEVVN